MTKKYCIASSLPTAMVLIGTALLSTVIMLPLPGRREPQETLSVRFMLTVVHAIPLLFAGYTINCMVAGRCLLWSYIVTAIVLLWILAVVVNVLDLAAAPPKQHCQALAQRARQLKRTLTFMPATKPVHVVPPHAYTDTSMPHMELPVEEEFVDDAGQGEGDELTDAMRRYCQTSRDAGFPPATFGSASSDMGYYLPGQDTE